MSTRLHLKLGQKLLLFTILAILPPLLIAGSYYYSFMQRQILSQHERSLFNNLNIVKYQLNRELAHFANTAKVIATDPELRKALDTDNSLGLNSQLNRLASVYAEINYLVLLDANKTVFAINTINNKKQKVPSEEFLGSSLTNHPLLPELSNQPTFSAPGKDPLLKNFMLKNDFAQWFSAPVIVKGKAVGWLILSYTWQQTMTALNKAITADLNKHGVITIGGAITDQANQLMAGFITDYEHFNQSSIPFEIGNKTFNLILQTDSTTTMLLLTKQRNSLLLSSLIIFIIVMAIFYYIVYRQFLIPIRSLHQGTKKYAEGNYDFRLDTFGKDELSELATSFNGMGIRLQDARHNLESKVENRTQALTVANKKLEVAIEEVTHANLVKNEFLASMSHEIRTPMNGVLGMLHLLEETSQNDKQRHFTHLAKTSADSLLSVINDILDFSKVEAGKLELEMINFDLESLFGDFVETMAVQKGERPIEIILDIDENACRTVNGDPGRLRQILNNIVGNALKFTHQGEIEIGVSIEPLGNLEQLTFTVTDTGIGIDKSAIINLFNPFTQVDSSTTRKYGGTGLGLAIVNQLCELMGGSISVQSEVNKGSTFTIFLLLNASKQPAKQHDPIDLTSKRLLIVDGNPACLKLLQDRLTDWGATVVTAADSKIALNIVQQPTNNHFDAILFDNNQPYTDAQALANIVTNQSTSPLTRLVLCPPIGYEQSVTQLNRTHFNEILHKPIRLPNLHKLFAQPAKPLPTLCQPLLTPSPEAKNTSVYQGHVLLVEDNQINQVVAKEVLEGFGLQVTIAEHGMLALELLNQHSENNQFSLVIMDCQMPVLDGYQATVKIRAGEGGINNSNITIIAMTANAMNDDKEKCLAVGMTDYISKPIMPTKLKQKLQRYLPQLTD